MQALDHVCGFLVLTAEHPDTSSWLMLLLLTLSIEMENIRANRIKVADQGLRKQSVNPPAHAHTHTHARTHRMKNEMKEIGAARLRNKQITHGEKQSFVELTFVAHIQNSNCHRAGWRPRPHTAGPRLRSIHEIHGCHIS